MTGTRRPRQDPADEPVPAGGSGPRSGSGPRDEASGRGTSGREAPGARPARLAALLGTLAVLAFAVVGVLLLVGGDPAPPAAALVWAAIGVVIAGVLLATAWRTPSLRVPEVVVEYALVLVGGALAFVVAGSVSGGAPAAVPSVVGLVAGVVALGTGVGTRVARRRRAGRRA